jgi:hypothetical protein
MTRSQAFTAAHALTRRTLRAGDNYAATFALCLKAVYADCRAGMHPYDRPIEASVYQGHSSFPAIVSCGAHNTLPGMPRAWADKAAAALNACATRTEQGAEARRIRAAIAGRDCVVTAASWPYFPAAYRARLAA